MPPKHLVIFSFVAALSWSPWSCCLAAVEETGESVVVVTTSDTHFGVGKSQEERAKNLALAQARPVEIAALIGTELPRAIREHAGGMERVPRPRGILVAGDLTDGSPNPDICRQQWAQFAAAYPGSGLAIGQDRIPIFPSLGNHDGGLFGPVAPLVFASLDRLGERGEIASRSAGGLHYALHWGRLHVLCLNLCAAEATDPAAPFRYGVQGQGSWNDPQEALTYLKTYLATRVGDSGDPVMIVTHYGFDSFSREWNWWSRSQRAAFYRVLEPYRIVALVHGHNHQTAYYHWPDPHDHADDLTAIFGATPPSGYRQYDVFSNGGTGWWLVLGKDRLTAFHRSPDAWNERLTTSYPLPTVPAGSVVEPALKVPDPQPGEQQRESPHLVVRWTASSAAMVREEDVAKGLATLEGTLAFYRSRLGWPSPFASLGSPWKIQVFLDDQVPMPNGSGHGNLMSMRIRVGNLLTPGILAHELTHCLQFASGGFKDSRYVGWLWESHANWMKHQRFPDEMCCWDQLIDCPHLAYGTSRNRYGNWHFLDYLQRRFGNDAVLDLWFRSPRPTDPARNTTDPFLVLRETRGWTQEDLNDHFGTWALENAGVAADPDGVVSAWEQKSAQGPSARHRLASLVPVAEDSFSFRIPDYWAPQRLGYNKVRLEPLPGAKSIAVDFTGLTPIRNAPERAGWRWGLVARGADGAFRRSPLYRGTETHDEFGVSPTDREVFLVVLAAPTVHEQVAWDQPYATVGRYPWRVRLSGARPWRRPLPMGAGAPHPNGGGWVAATAKVGPKVYVGPEARVLDHARIEGSARIEDGAEVSGNAVVTGEVVIRDQAFVGGGVTLSGSARIAAATILTGHITKVTGTAIVETVAYPIQNVRISGNAHLYGDLELHRDVSTGELTGFVP